MLLAEMVEALELPWVGEVARRVVGMDDHDGPRARSDGARERFELDLPAVVVNQFVGDEADVLDVGEEIKDG